MSEVSRRAAVAVMATAALALAGCSSAKEQAREQAVDEVLATVKQTAQALRGRTSGLPADAGSETVLDAAEAGSIDSADRLVIGKGRSGNAPRMDLALSARAQVGGGGTYADHRVRVCARFTITPGPEGNVRAENRTCPPLAGTPMAGQVDSTVALPEPVTVN